MIKQIINTHQQVQTGLAVEVNGRWIDYEPLNDTFGYKFWTTIGINEDEEKAVKEADAAIDEIISAMCSQSYDHGAVWRLTSKEVSEEYLDRYGQYYVKAYFRIKDSY